MAAIPKLARSALSCLVLIYGTSLAHAQDSFSEVDVTQPTAVPTDEPIASPSETQSPAEQRVSLRSSSSSESNSSYFGSTMVGIGVSRPKFTDNELYDDFYGRESIYPTFSVDHFFFSWYATLGIGVRFGLYNDSGSAAGSGTDESDIELEGESDVTFTMVPAQIVIVGNAPILPWKWATLSGWWGFERTFWQELREDTSGEEASASADVKPFVNKGFKNGTVIGGALNLQLNWLDSTSRGGLTDALGIRTVNLSPSVEYVTATDDKGILLSRVSYGLHFTFEM